MPCRWMLYCMMIASVACSSHKKDLAGEQPVDAEDFKAAFHPFTLQKGFYDTSLAHIADTTTISYAVFSQFVPDSILKKRLDKSMKKIVIHPVGSIAQENELYLLANFIQEKKIKLIVFVFDEKFKYLANLELMSNTTNDGYMHSVTVNSEPTFMVVRQKTGNENNLLYTRNGFGYNKAAGDFIIVMNDSNEDLKENKIMNPIDTLPKHNKFSADYVENKKKFISVRDGRNKDEYLFFIHFEKNDGNCTGELKGDMKMRNATKGYFQKSGDPCVIDFSFNGNEITVKERGNCGNHRGIRCFFDDSYTRKKEKKTKGAK